MSKKKADPKKPVYDEASIKQLKGLEAVRARPGMYLGDPTSGDALHHCIKEVVDNSVDEHLAGTCTQIEVTLEPDGWCEVVDNGRGIPVGKHPTEGISTLQVVMCSLHAGGKFDNDSYEQSAGLHGIGVAAVNAVSEIMEAHVWRDGKLHVQQYEFGIPVTPVVDMGGPVKITGTKIRWKRDLKIFTGVTEYDRKTVADRLQELAFLNPGLIIKFTDNRGKAPKVETFQFEQGIRQYLEELVGKKSRMTPVLYFSNEFEKAKVEMAFVWTDTSDEDVRCYVNNTYNRDGGTHQTGFRNGITRTVINYAKEHNMLKGLPAEGITGNDVREGMVGVVNLRMGQVGFSNQTKDKLITPRGRTLVEELFQDQVEWYLKENPGIAKKIADKAVLSAQMREAARKARDAVKRQDIMDPLSLPGKLADCQSSDPTECEIYIVEGDSAGGSAKMARDRRTQAILPLRGKVLNVERVDAETICENKELGTIINAFGCGIEQLKTFNLKKLRYHKVVLMTDADVDGAHIRTLLLTFLYRCMPKLIYAGHVYIAQPPLYCAHLSGSADHFFTTELELDAFRRTASPAQKERMKVTRYKGLGEMNAEDLWETTLNPANRTLKQVTIDDAIEAEHYFGLLMGDDVEGRRVWIEENGSKAKDLDV